VKVEEVRTKQSELEEGSIQTSFPFSTFIPNVINILSESAIEMLQKLCDAISINLFLSIFIFFGVNRFS
jgi:hypothetical protein